MYDSSADILSFQNNHVSLQETHKKKMRERRAANRNRLTSGLEEAGIIQKSFQPQGSYAMHTMVQDDDNDYDIDDGVVFDIDDLVGEQGAEYTGLRCRQLIHDALTADNSAGFKTPPEILKNCVRVHYDDGTHVDLPGYREHENGCLELASSEWKESDPQSVTDWFNSAVKEKSPDDSNGRQMRRVTRLIKKMGKSRSSWKTQMPSGFIISVLVDECYVADEREDIALYETIVAIRDRLRINKEVFNPVDDKQLTKSSNDANLVFFESKLTYVISKLSQLLDDECNEKKALESWNFMFKHDYFSDRIESINEEKKNEIANSLKSGNVAAASGSIIMTSSPNVVNVPVKSTRAYGN